MKLYGMLSHVAICHWLLSIFMALTTGNDHTNGHGDAAEKHENTKLLIISFDGFRWDYLKRTHTPNFDWVKDNGVTAKFGLKNAFPTVTFPNHITLVSGLWVESHGIVGNTMYDPLLKEEFYDLNKSQVAASRWFDVGSEPIWVTNQLQKQYGRSGCMMWVGCEAPIKGVTPTYHIPYDAAVSNFSKIDSLIKWFTSEYPINLGLLYFDQPDDFAHTYGPDSPQVTAMIAGLDNVVGYLLQKLNDSHLLESTNLIITSDHGFTTVSKEWLVNLDDYISPDTYRNYAGAETFSAILPNSKGKVKWLFAISYHFRC